MTECINSVQCVCVWSAGDKAEGEKREADNEGVQKKGAR
jgi:hypothetical protein